MNIHSLEAGATYEHIFYERRLDHGSILSRSGRAMAHDEEQLGHSAVKQNRPTLSKAPIYGWWRPAWNLSFEGRVGNVAVSRPTAAGSDHRQAVIGNDVPIRSALITPRTTGRGVRRFVRGTSNTTPRPPRTFGKLSDGNGLERTVLSVTSDETRRASHFAKQLNLQRRKTTRSTPISVDSRPRRRIRKLDTQTWPRRMVRSQVNLRI